MAGSGSIDVSIILSAACSDKTQHGINIEKKDSFGCTQTKNPGQEMIITAFDNKQSNKKKSSWTRHVLNKIMKIKGSMTRRVKHRQTRDTEFCFEDEEEYYQQEFTTTTMNIDNEWLDLGNDFEFYPSEEFWDIAGVDMLPEAVSENGGLWEVADGYTSSETPAEENKFCKIAKTDSQSLSDTQKRKTNKLGRKLLRNLLCCSCKTTR
ncbi:uncharacterized protein LOC134686675 [Mytilus trossulus]|uniref:uncharacterized protein LOC134686675 n=1 Tax=Mytilus trossulus TaxID=6551 RepID=UPI003007085E